jgi:hypothetical protein
VLKGLGYAKLAAPTMAAAAVAGLGKPKPARTA